MKHKKQITGENMGQAVGSDIPGDCLDTGSGGDGKTVL